MFCPDPEASIVPSGEKSTETTPSGCASMAAISCLSCRHIPELDVTSAAP